MQCTGNYGFPALERKTAPKIVFRHASGLFFQIEDGMLLFFIRMLSLFL